MTFKNSDGNYKDNVTFEEIYALYNFDKNIKYLFLKYTLEIEIQIKALIANHISKVYGIKDYLKESNLEMHLENEEIDMENTYVKNQIPSSGITVNEQSKVVIEY